MGYTVESIVLFYKGRGDEEELGKNGYKPNGGVIIATPSTEFMTSIQI